MSDIVTPLKHWITQLAEHFSGQALTSIHHRLDQRLLAEAHRRLDGRKAPGIDGQTKAEYGKDLARNLDELVARVRTQAYRAPAVRRVDLAKPDGGSRPIGISTYEDKVLQKGFVLLVEPVFEREFHDGSYGYRPGRTAHDAIRAVDRALGSGHHWVIELDIKGYFDSIAHNDLREMFGHRIKDGVLNRLVLGWLKAGVLKEGQWQSSDEGTPQGGIVSPLLANLYLHEVLDQWLEHDVKPCLQSSVQLIRYADDAVLCFRRQEDAYRVFKVLGKRFAKFGLTLHPEKTRLTDFRPPEQREEGQRATFNFLGFTFYWGTTRKGKRIVKLKTERKRLVRKLQALNEECRQNRHLPMAEQQARLKQKLQGHVNYYGVSHNYRALKLFVRGAEAIWRKWLNRRGAPRRFTVEAWARIVELRPWVTIQIKHRLFNLNPLPRPAQQLTLW
jgi:group II intron reverse transcriptase/maturase